MAALFPDDFPFNSRTPSVDSVSSITYAEPMQAVEPIAPAAPAPAPIIEPVAPVTAVPTTPAHPPPSSERRKALRHTLVARAQLRADMGFTSLVNVDVQNISLIGVRFLSQHPIDAQQKAQLRMEAGPLRWSSRVRVVTCQADNAGRYHIGCQFVGNEMMKPWGATTPAGNAAAAA
jgi:hypothetical protein